MPQSLVVETRPQALRRLVTNLLDNAVKYSGAAELTARRVDGGTYISVSDRGSGIPPDRIDEVRKPFVRLEPSRNRDTGGTELGLAIADQLACALGTKLRLEPREGEALWPQ